MGPILVLLVSLASRAETPVPSYRAELIRGAWDEANALLEAGLPEKAAESAERFQRDVVADGGLEYLVGLSWRLRNDAPQAEIHYRRAIDLDETRVEAWYDLGEIYLSDGRFDEADRAFAEVSTRLDTGPQAWRGPWRSAEVAAWRHDPEAFERHMHEALKRGFSFRTIAGLPNWKQFYADPAMHDSVEKLITVYGTPETLRSLESP